MAVNIPSSSPKAAGHMSCAMASFGLTSCLRARFDRVFRAGQLDNMADMQAVLDAVERALEAE